MFKPLIRILILPVMLLPAIAGAQPRSDVGVFGGTAYYLGDINPGTHFYRPSLSFGFLYRYNINTRYAIRGNAYMVDLSGNDLDFPSRLNPDRPLNPRRFQTTLADLSLQAEFNFLPYTSSFKWEYSPYITAGIAGSFIAGSDTDATNTVTIPFGIGVKVCLSSRLSTGAEWGFRKTFSDRLDGVENPSGTSSLIHNNDWYSLIGIFITYKFFNFATECPAYD